MKSDWCRITPDKAITQISWRPSGAESTEREIAVASEDGSVRVYKASLTQ
jgi:elongator complex protein 2